MEDDKKNEKVTEEANAQEVEACEPPSPKSVGGGGWSFSPFSVLSNLQNTAQKISRNAAVAAEKAAKSIADMQIAENSEPSLCEGEHEKIDYEKEAEDDDDKLRKSTLDKLENASEDSVFGQGLKVLDHSVENLTSGAWQALGSAWKEGSIFVQKLENSAVTLAESIQRSGLSGGTGSVAPSLLETAQAFTAKGMQVLEYAGKETMDLLITETGIEVESNSNGVQLEADDDNLHEEVTFDRCFYIYGGPEQLEELEALSNHYALLFNRRKAKLLLNQKSVYEEKLKLVQQIFNFAIEMEGNAVDVDKGKKIETGFEKDSDDLKILHDSSVNKAADIAAGFGSALAGLLTNDIIQRTTSRLETLHSEGVHGLSEMCCSALSHFLMLGKSIIGNSSEGEEYIADADTDTVNVEWPEDSVDKAKLIRMKAYLMIEYMEAVSNSFLTGISDVAEAYAAAMKTAAAESHGTVTETSLIQEKANTFSELLRSDNTAAVSRIQDGLQYLSYVVISTTLPAA